MIHNFAIHTKNILRISMLAFCGIFLGINIYLANAQKIIGNELPMHFGYGAAVVLSGSMEPRLSVNDLIIVEQKEDYVPGDIVVYQEKTNLIVHRIVSIDNKSITTKGDANFSMDNPIDASSIKGKVIFTIPYIGALVNFLKTPSGFIITLLLSFFIFAPRNFNISKVVLTSSISGKL